MAYPTVSSPYGLKPINLIGGQPYAGSTRAFKIASGYNQNIFYGDVVKINRKENLTGALGESPVGTPIDGSIVVQKFYVAGKLDIAGTSFTPSAFPFALGVFMGCSYTDPVLKYKLFSQYYPAGLVADDIEAYVVDDPDALFKAVSITNYNSYSAPNTGMLTGTTVGAVSSNVIGANAYLVYNGGDTNTGNSLSGISTYYTPAPEAPVVTAGVPFRVVDVVPATETPTGFVELIVKFNQSYFISGSGLGGGHEYQWPGYPG